MAKRKLRDFPSGAKASEIIRYLGAEISWEILKCEDKWYVIAAHNGITDDDCFKVERANYSLDLAVEYVGKFLWKHGPKWIRTWDDAHRSGVYKWPAR
jgi:hypothetical protein